MKTDSTLRILRLLFFAAVVPLLAACAGNGDEPQPEPQPDPAPVPPSSEVAGRTVLVYMVARNSLGSYEFDSSDLEEMKVAAREGALGSNRLLVFHSRQGEAPALKEVSREGIKVLKKYASDFVAVDDENMRSVIGDAKMWAPAEHYGIVLWSHANGWLQTGIKPSAPQQRAFGDDSGRSMNVTTLAKVLDGRDFDFVYFDCCFMGGVEVAYELRDVTRRIAASVSELPSAGMPYNLTLPYLMADEADVEGAARATFSSYDALTGNARTCTMSVIDTSGLPALADAVRGIYVCHPRLGKGAMERLQQYVSYNDRRYYGLFYDLRHYLKELTESSHDMLPLYSAAVDALEGCVVYKASTPYLWQRDAHNSAAYEVKVDWHCGLSTYVTQSPETAANKGYDELSWYRDVASALF